MSSVAILTDSNSGITQEEAEELGVYVLPMPFFINGIQYYEGITLTEAEFYERMTAGENVTTSQPSIGEMSKKWDELLQTYQEIVFIPMSSGLSSTCQTAQMLASDYDDKVQVVDNQRISVTMRQSVQDAKLLVDKGYRAKEIKEILEREKLQSSIYITVDTLDYLKKGGRITPAAAKIGTLLNIKPILQIQGSKLDAFAKVRGKQQAKRTMLKAMKNDLDTRFKDAAEKGRIHLAAAYIGNRDDAEEWAATVQEAFPEYKFHMDPLSLVIACHIGPGALAIAASKYLPEL